MIGDQKWRIKVKFIPPDEKEYIVVEQEILTSNINKDLAYLVRAKMEILEKELIDEDKGEL